MWPSLQLAAEHPERVLGIVALAPGVPLPTAPDRRAGPVDDGSPADEGWAKDNRHYWRGDHREFLEFFFGELFPEPHSTKQLEDARRLRARRSGRGAR